MPTSEARILANQANSAKSTGPKTVEGKERSRANAYKHGLTGDGVVVSESDFASIERLTTELTIEFRPKTATSRLLVERMAVHAVRMERSVKQESAAIAENVRQAEDDFEAPEDLDPAVVAKLRREAGQIALFDPSKEATLARKYEASAERGFYRALKDLRQIQKQAAMADTEYEPESPEVALGSFFPVETIKSVLDSLPVPPPQKPASSPQFSSSKTAFDVPITIGRAR